MLALWTLLRGGKYPLSFIWLITLADSIHRRKNLGAYRK